MKAVLLNIYGPVAVQSYGLCIAIGVVLSFYFLSKDKKLKQLISYDQLMNCFQIGFFAAVFGGRTLFFISNPDQLGSVIDFVWNGGLSILGALIATIIALVAYVKKIKVSPALFLDRVAIYAPFMEACGRVGCFMSGCCYGISSSLPWAFAYTDIDTKAPLCISLHPVQLYTAALFALVFAFLYLFLQRKNNKPGALFWSYLSLTAAIRFGTDFWRGDREFSAYVKIFSISQIVAILIFMCAIIGLVTVFFSKKNHGSI
jgi:phosphatidylglycerol:prolipoprotein diacylglycerol transferase